MARHQKDYYEILEVHPKASQEVIHRAYLVLAKKYHPDTQQEISFSTDQKMKDLNEAYRVLSDPVLRTQYDAGYHGQKEEPRPAASTKSELTIIHNEIAVKCKELIDEHATSIIKKDEAITSNRALCERLYAKFNKDVIPLVAKMQVYREKDFSAFQDAMTWAAAALFTVGVGFTWANDYVRAEMLLSQALGFHPEPKMARQISDVYANIRTPNTQHSHQEGSDSTPTSTDDAKAMRVAGIATIILFIIFAVFVAFSSNPWPKENKAKTPPTPPVTSKQKPSPPSPIKPVFTPILDKPTGYDQSIKRQKIDGHCQVTVDNTRNDYPVLVRLYMMLRGDESTRIILSAFYIQKGEMFTEKNIPAGSYGIHYKNLKTGASFKAPPFDLEEKESKSGIEYSVVRITLFTVPSGNIRLVSIPEDEF